MDSLICAALRGEAPAWPFENAPWLHDAFLARCVHHGVQVLLYGIAQRLSWPAAVLESLRKQAMGWAAWEQRHRVVLGHALERLASQRLEAVIFKGTALAYSVYPEPFMRPRADTDLLIPAANRKQVARVLESAGFERKGSVEPEFVSYEASFKCAEGGVTHMIDLHWRIHYSQLQAQRVSYELLRSKARPLAKLSADALRVSAPHALLLNCIHRSNDLRIAQWVQDQPAFGQERLIWIYDIHLLLQQMSREEMDEFGSVAQAAGALSVCREPIELASESLGTAIPASLRTQLCRSDGKTSIATYQASSPARQKWADLSALEGLRARLGYILEHVAPPPEYMRERYPRSAHSSMASLHVRRLLSGLDRWHTMHRR